MRRTFDFLCCPVAWSLAVLLIVGCGQRERAPDSGWFGPFLEPQAAGGSGGSSGSGGTAGSGGSGGDAGSGGTAGSGGSGGSGGDAGSGGTVADAGTDVDGGTGGTIYRSAGGGCACHVGASPEASQGLGLLGFVPLLAIRRRRRLRAARRNGIATAKPSPMA
ncbi:MYXO-CTERM sorting domain-containing protein [Polyangium sp. 6x1]|uniref:MYXO-CTERM sorting domain-containing protein n=1 Tax=Polyangium sp. 6x1 TaxID=3042689 RepID=UPI00248275AD|nr:MYXO-CTERM sorting domain-containing protein [Polyangium sp. 6x1]MDI1449617.1 MYXO-CTERM sorting domain-containing protein [Polyangium sp. 6x1]